MIQSNTFLQFDIIESYNKINIYITISSQDLISIYFSNLIHFQPSIQKSQSQTSSVQTFFFYNFNFQTSIFIIHYLSFHFLHEILSLLHSPRINKSWFDILKKKTKILIHYHATLESSLTLFFFPLSPFHPILKKIENLRATKEGKFATPSHTAYGSDKAIFYRCRM